MKILMEKIDRNLEKNKYLEMLKCLNEYEADKIQRFMKYEDSLRSLYGKYMIKKYLGVDKLNLSYNQWKKPFLVDFPNTHINISHSHEWVVVAIDENPVGIDIEKIQDIDMSIAKSFFSKSESEYIFSLHKEKQLEEFYKIWTIKEAYIKWKGMGMYIDLNSFDVVIDNNRAYIYTKGKKEKCLVYLKKIENEYILSYCVEDVK